MSNNLPKLSSNLATVLFSNNTPLSLRLYSGDASGDPFEKLRLQMDSSYYVGQLSLGGDFYQQTVLLKIYDQDDKSQTNLVKRLSQCNQQKNNPFPPLLSFDTDSKQQSQVFSPLFYCRQKNVFFNAFCETCQSVLTYNDKQNTIECKFCMSLSKNKKQFHIDNIDSTTNTDALFLSFGNLQGSESKVPCITCDEHSSCFNQKPGAEETKAKLKPRVLENIFPISIKNFSLYAVEYTPLKLNEFSDLVGGMKKSSLYALLEKQSELSRFSMIESSVDLLLAATEGDIFSSLRHKLQICLELCDIALSLENQNFSSDEYMKAENIRVKTQLNGSTAQDIVAHPNLLPLLHKSIESKGKENIASLHIKNIINAKNEKNTVIETVMFDEGGLSVLVAPGDVIELHFDNGSRDNDAVPYVIELIVKQKKYESIVLETLEVLSSDVEQTFLSYFLQEPSQKVNYALLNELTHETAYKNLSHLFFMLLLRNSVLGEAEINHALKILLSKIQKLEANEVNEALLNTVIHTTPALSVVFRQENTLYKPEINSSQLIPDLYWLKLLSLCINLGRKKASGSQSVLYDVKNNLQEIIAGINQSDSIENIDKVDDAELIKSALSGIIDDASWLDAALASKELTRDNVGSSSNASTEDKTLLYPKEKTKPASDDSTLIMPKRNS